VRYVKYRWASCWGARLLESGSWALTRLCLNSRAPDMVKRILIIEPFRLGDAVLLSDMPPLLHGLFPQAGIDVAVGASGAEWFAGKDEVSVVHKCVFPWVCGWSRVNLSGTIRLVRLLRKYQYDLAIDPRGDIRTQLIMILAGCRIRVGLLRYIGSNMRLKGRALTHALDNRPGEYRLDLNRRLCFLAAGVPEEPQKKTARHYDIHQPTHVLIHPGCGWKHREWGVRNWVALIHELQKLGCEIAVIGSSVDQFVLARIKEHSSVKVRTADSIEDFKQHLNVADILICLDSAPMHIAALAGKPMVVLFGPGDVGAYAPRGPQVRLVHHQDQFLCAPCTQKKCVHPLNNCMACIAVGEVVSAVMELVLDESSDKIGAV